MEIFDQYLVFGIVLTDPSSASDCLSHKPLAKKLNTCELEISAVRLVFYYLTNRGQQSKIGCNYSLWKELLFWVPQESFLAPTLFSVYLYNLFLLTDNIDIIATYADDTTP